MFVVVSPSDRFKVRVLLTLPTPRLVVVWFLRVIHGDSGDGVGLVPTRRHRRRAIRQLVRHRRRPCRRLDSTFGTLRGLPDNAERNRAATLRVDFIFRVIRRSGSRNGYPSFAGRYSPNWLNNSRNSLTNCICSFVVSNGSRKVTNRWHLFRLSFG